MKRLIVLGSICALWLLASCSPGEGTVASCASAFVGSFEGMDNDGNPVSGALIGQLDAVNGELEVLFQPEGADPQPGQAAVDENGALVDPFIIITSGSINLDDCTATGEYDFGFFGEGTWELALPDPAF